MTHTTRRQTYLTALTQYATRTGHTRVPVTHNEQVNDTTVPLGNWVSYIRQRCRAGLLPQEVVAQLNEIPNWFWEAQRPGPTTDLNRNNEIINKRHQGISLQKIGDEYGLSRQRIHQIIKGHK